MDRGCKSLAKARGTVAAMRSSSPLVLAAGAVAALLPVRSAHAYGVGTIADSDDGTAPTPQAVATVVSSWAGYDAETAGNVGSPTGPGSQWVVFDVNHGELGALSTFTAMYDPGGGGPIVNCGGGLVPTTSIWGLCAQMMVHCGGIGCGTGGTFLQLTIPTFGMELIPPPSFIDVTTTHGAFDAGPAVLETTVVTDADAALVDMFALGLGVTGCNSPSPAFFEDVTTLEELADAIDGLCGALYTVEATVDDTLRFTAVTPGPAAFSAFALTKPTLAAPAVVTITGVSDAIAADVNALTLDLSGTVRDGDGIDWGAVASGAELAAALESLDIVADATWSAADDGTLTLTSATGAYSWDEVSLRVVPVVTASGALSAFVEGTDEPVDAQITVTFPGGTLVHAEVAFTAGYVMGEDALSATATSAVALSFDASGGVLALDGAGTAAEYQSVLRSVVYANDSEDPTGTSRTFAIRVFEGPGDDQGGSNAVARSMTVSALDDAPEITLGAGPSMIAAGEVHALAPLLEITDVDDTELAGATVQFEGDFDDTDELAVTVGGGVTGGYDPVTGILSLSGDAHLATYEAVLRSVTYRSSATSGGIRPRSVRFVVAGDTESLPVFRQFGVTVCTSDGCPGGGEGDGGVMSGGGSGGGCSASPRSSTPAGAAALVLVAAAIVARRRRRAS